MIQLILNLMIEVEDVIDYLMMLYLCLWWDVGIIMLILVRSRREVLLGGMMWGRGLWRVCCGGSCGGGILCSLLCLFSLIRLLFRLFFYVYLCFIVYPIYLLYLLPFFIDQHPKFPSLLQNHPNCPSIIHY